MPIGRRLRLAEHRENIRRDQPLHRDAAKIHGLQIVSAGYDQQAAVEKAVAEIGLLLDRLLGQQRPIDRRAGGLQTEQDFEPGAAEFLERADGEQRLARLAARQDRHVPGDQHGARIGMAPEFGEKSGVVAPLRDPVELIAMKARIRSCAARS